MSRRVRCFDLFCGGGGSSRGASLAGAEIAGGIDAWRSAVDTFSANFPGAAVWHSRVEEIDPGEIAARLGAVDLLLASPECTSHSPARGGAPKSRTSQDTAWAVIRYAAALRPRWVVVENVIQMARWAGFSAWMLGIHRLGYQTCRAVLSAEDYRVPQTRRRLYILCDRDAAPTPPPPVGGPWLPAASILRCGEPMESPWPYRPLFTSHRAAATIARAERAIKALGSRDEFILTYYGSDWTGYQTLDRPLRTVTTVDRFAHVRPGRMGHEMRMLQPTELAAAMGFPPSHQWAAQTRRDALKLIGNAVCPPVMRAIVEHLTTALDKAS